MKTLMLYLKWSILVGLNTLISVLILLIDSITSWQIALGIMTGILTFILFYANLDKILKKKGLDNWRDALQSGIVISAIIYLIMPFIPLGTGALALNLIGNNPSIISIYFIVILDGLVLSALAMIPVLMIYLMIIHLGKSPD